MDLKSISQTMIQAAYNKTSADFQQVATLLSVSKDAVREEMQSMTSTNIRRVIEKLISGNTLSADDKAALRLWIVGDAESYTKMEDDLGEWLDEFSRLQGVIKSYENKDLNSADIAKVYGLLEDAMRVAFDIANFMEKKERVEKFDKGIANVDTNSKQLLADLLMSKLRSPNM